MNSSINVDYTQVNINNILYWVRENGLSGNNAVSHGSGGIFPRGTAGIIFYDGILWAGKVKDGDLPELRAGGSLYASGTLSGAILVERTGIAEDPDSPDVRIWRVRKDWASVDLKIETAEYFDIPMDSVTYSQIAIIRTKYRDDWNEWPAEKGAPYYDLDKNGSYDPAIDIPGIANADQVIWFVVNDLDDGAVRGLFGSPSIGIEHQVTLWAYDRVGKLGNIIFKRNRIIYKGTAETPPTAFIENMYISQRVDSEIGFHFDDLIGSDPSVNVGFTYNSGDIDEDFESFGLPPPSMGYVLNQGPIVPSEGDEAIFDFRIRRDHKNLRMTSFSDPVACLPDCIQFFIQGGYSLTTWVYDIMQGLQYDGTPLIDPNTQDTTKFYASGDPVTGSGWIDGTAVAPGDRRMILSSGPFSMALGDTQEIVIAIVAGIGINRLEGFAEMKELARFSNSLSLNMFTDPLKVETIISQPNSEEVEILISAVTAANVERVITRVFNYNDEIEATFDLSIRDNVGGDSLTWTMNWLTDQREYGMYANFYLISGGDTAVWEHQLDNITTLGPVEWNDLIILDDNVNNDGKINVGEKIIFTPLIENRSSMSIENAKISVSILDENIIDQTLGSAESVDTLFPGVYTLEDRYFALSLNTPVSDDLEVILSIIDRSHNRWESAYPISVTKTRYTPRIIPAEQIAGNSNVLVGWRAADIEALTEDAYKITF
ncbi:MAG: hypothetical protein IH825_04115, partial [Candidatus Marinimicrobia bacterium]|nr:hypothetical protein [Candidatus Neomarinimicrobiota bacterium]